MSDIYDNDDLSDEELFRQAVGEVTPVKNDKANLRPANASNKRKRHVSQDNAIRRQAAVSDAAVPVDGLSSEDYVEPVDSETYLEFSCSGIQHKKMKRLKSGLIAYEDVLDLHGYKAEQARTTLMEFIRHCQHQGLQCVKVIHGKGNSQQGKYPILKSNVHHWLPQIKEVMAYCSAQPRDGGAGAVTILLRRLK